MVCYLIVGGLLLTMTANADDEPLSPFEDCEAFAFPCPERGPDSGADVLDPEVAGGDNSIFALLDAPNRFVSLGLNGLVRRIDEFFAAEKLYYDSSGSYIRVRADSIWQQRDASGFNGDIRLKMKLPRTNEKYRFVLESEPDKIPDDPNETIHDTPLDAADNQAYFAGLQAVGGRHEGWRFRAGIGIKLRSPVDSYFHLGAQRTYSFEYWSWHLDESLYNFDHAGKSSITTLELDRRLSDMLLFRASSRARWSKVNDYFEASQVFSLFQTLDERRLVSLHAGVYGLTEPALQAKEYRVSLSFRQNIRKKYLFVELIPQIHFRQSRDFFAERGFVLRLEWVFAG